MPAIAFALRVEPADAVGARLQVDDVAVPRSHIGLGRDPDGLLADAHGEQRGGAQRFEHADLAREVADPPPG